MSSDFECAANSAEKEATMRITVIEGMYPEIEAGSTGQLTRDTVRSEIGFLASMLALRDMYPEPSAPIFLLSCPAVTCLT